MNKEITIAELKEKAKLLRKTAVTMIYEAQSGHPGRSLSMADIVACLYFREMNVDPKNPRWEERDRFILSKGNVCPIQYSALGLLGFFPEEDLHTLCKEGSKLQGHLWYREMNLKEVYIAIKQTVAESAGILLIICGAAAFSWLVTMLGLTNALAQVLTNMTDNKYIMLLILNIAFLIIGMFMEALAVLTITVPFLIPLIAVLFLITYVPGFVTWLPGLLG